MVCNINNININISKRKKCRAHCAPLRTVGPVRTDCKATATQAASENECFAVQYCARKSNAE